MARYLVESRHTNEECLKTLDELAAQGESVLGMWDFACATGDHSNHLAVAVLEAPSEAAARSALPEGMRGAAITETGRLTVAQVRSFHQ
jgi:hypothetical protein